MLINRRSLIASSAALALLTGCAGGISLNQALSQAATDVSTIAAGLMATLPAIGAAVGITPEKVAAIGAAIADIQKVASGVSAASTDSAAQPLVQQLEADINVVVGILATIPGLPPQVTLALQAAAVLLPVIETAIGMLVPAPAPATAKMRASVPATMTPDQARLILIGLTGK